MAPTISPTTEQQAAIDAAFPPPTPEEELAPPTLPPVHDHQVGEVLPPGWH